jgi:hypothetical protein
MTEWDLAYMRRSVQPTDADIDRIADAVPIDNRATTWHRRFARAVLAAQPLHEQLREMGEAHAAQPAPAEPEYWQWRRKGEQWDIEQIYRHEVHATTDDSEVRKLYTHPAAPVPVPLTDEQIDALYINGTKHWIGKRHIARAIEAAHGIAASPEVLK